MLNFEDLAIIQWCSKAPGTGSIENSLNITWDSPSYFQLDWGPCFRNVRKSDVIGVVFEMLDIIVRRRMDVVFSGHIVCK
jgi:hypothetical protein